LTGPLLSPKGITSMSLTQRWIDEIEGQTGMPIIFAYTDRDALDDGALVDIASLNLTFEDKPINRITAALFWQEQKKYPLPAEQLTAQLADCADDQEPINFDLEAYAITIRGQLADAGGSDYLRTLPGPVWLIENETGGWTLMLPSDY
jgi:hypothetical protein